MRRPRWSSTLPKLAQITGPSSYHLAASDLFRLWFVRWRRPQLRSGSGRVENVRYGLLGLALTTTTTNRKQPMGISNFGVKNLTGSGILAISAHAQQQIG